MARSFVACLIRSLVLLAALLGQVAGWAQSGPQAAGPAGLRARHTAMAAQLADNPFRGPLVLESTEGTKRLQGDVHAVVDHPFAAVSAALANPAQWCEVLILHLNTKYCRRTLEDGKPRIELRVGKKHDQPVASASLVTFAFSAAGTTPQYLAVELQAPTGPFDTSDYGILVEAVPLEGGKTFLHMGYSFNFGTVSRMAMQLYLSTLARDKVGFTLASRPQPGEPPQYIGGMRGLVERNTMRYYLAIDAYLGAMDTPPAERVEKRLRDWFDATERYARQLHEIDRAAYLSMKRHEYQRQQAPA